MNDKLDPQDVQFVLQLIAHAKGAGITEISYRSCTIRFLPPREGAPDRVKVRPNTRWNNELGNAAEPE